MGRTEVIVLDTHIFIWFALNDPRLPEGFREIFESSPQAVCVPSICLWEALLLIERGRLKVGSDNPVEALRDFISEPGFKESPLTVEIAALSRTLEFDHDDPADRFIAATAYSLGAKLATEDRHLRRLPWLKHLH